MKIASDILALCPHAGASQKPKHCKREGIVGVLPDLTGRKSLLPLWSCLEWNGHGCFQAKRLLSDCPLPCMHNVQFCSKLPAIDHVLRGHVQMKLRLQYRAGRCKSFLQLLAPRVDSTAAQGEAFRAWRPNCKKLNLPEPSCDVIKLGEAIITDQLNVAKPQRT